MNNAGAGGLVAGFLEAAQQFVAALNGSIERLLRRLLLCPDLLQFFIDDGANLRHIAQTQSLW